MISFCTLCSSSSGNAVYLETENGAVLIDCGLSFKQLCETMRKANLSPEKIKALFITHEHSDHIKGAGVLSHKLNIPVFATEGTWNGMKKCAENVAPQNHIVISANESFFFQDLEIVPFSIPHDAADPVGYRFYGRGGSAAVATDLGYFSKNVENAIEGADAVVLESNHDPDLLRANPHYPQQLKTRILGRHGHLSNAMGADAALLLAKSGTKHLILGHLSSENNTPELAFTTTRSLLERSGAELGGDITLQVADKAVPSSLYILK